MVLYSARNTETGRPEVRAIAPLLTLAAFACELYLKSIHAECGTRTVPGSHDLLVLFQNLPKVTKSAVLRSWKEVTSRNPSFTALTSLNFVSVLTGVAGFFEQWRYRFESNGTALDDRSLDLVLLPIFFRTFMLTKHPEWRDEDESYFQSTLPAQ